MSLFRGMRTTSRSNKIEQFQSTICAYTPVNVIYGTAKVNPNLISYTDFTSKEKKQTQKSGKAKNTTITYLYSTYVELALGTSSALENGVIQDITKVWVNDKSYASLSELNANANNEGSPLALNRGDNSNPTQYMQTNHPDKAVGYDKLAYLYGKIFLGEDNASMPSMSFQVKGGLVGEAYKGDGTDANPAYIIKDILTQLGMGESIDAVSFDNYARYCYEADLLVSTPTDEFTSQKKAQEVIAELLTLTNTYMFWSVDAFKFVPRDDVRRGSWSPNTTVLYNLDENAFIEQSGGSPVIFKRKTSDEIYNYITVNFTNRSRDYEDESISFQDVASISEYGVRAVSYDAKWLHTKERALKYAQMRTRQAQAEVNQYQFQLPWNYARLECGDLVRISCNSLDISNEVVMVSEIVESKNGVLTVTALPRPKGEYTESTFTVVDEYNYQDFNIEPSDTKCFMFTPPASLMTSSDGVEVWCALNGTDSTWGGCQVFLSDGSEYEYYGDQGVSSAYGTITSNVSASSTSVNIRLNNPNTTELKNAGEVWVNGEVIGYSGITLTGANQYTLTGITRGLYSTTIANHSAGDTMVVLDGSLYVIALPQSALGKKLYLKAPSFNVFKGNGQSVNDVDAFEYNVVMYDIPNVSNVVAVPSGFSVTSSINSYQINVSWTAPSWTEYQDAMVYYKNSTHTAWTYADSGRDSAVITQAKVGDTYTIAVCVRDKYGNYELPDNSTQTACAVAVSSDVPNAPTGFSIHYTDVITLKWNTVGNAIIDRYEVRTAPNTDDNNVIYSGNSNMCEVQLTSRSGNLYLYAVASNGEYSAYTSLQYNKTAPSAPTFTVSSGLRTISLISSNKPSDCYAINYSIVGTKYSYEITTVESNTVLNVEADIYSVTAKWVDVFGVGAGSVKSITVEQTIKPDAIHITNQTVFDDGVIVSGMLSSNCVTAEKMDVDSLSAITATIGTLRTATSGARTEIKDNLIEVYDSNNVLRVRLGVW